MLLLCAIEFASARPIAEPLAQLYAETFRCDGGTTQPATAPLSEINRYFPHRLAIWPVLDQNADPREARAWVRNDIHPGVLLPPVRIAAADGETIERLRALEAAGAVPVATLDEATPRALQAERYAWCMNALCPAAWLLRRGLGAELSLLPPGLYLSAPHWHGEPELPLPNRQMRIWGRRVLTLHRTVPDGGGSAAVINPGQAVPAFDPAPSTQWEWLGQRFSRDQAGLETSLIGRAQLAAGRLAFSFWRRVEPVQLSLPELAASGLGWLSIGLAGFNVLAILILVLLRTGMHTRSDGPR